ncbi:hypothetical protein L210DRAFT_924651 [Boletus edulis BED1]|uniref:Uncharacterized protein n=1 Tax=Boletus edulis BED1 TaxID=1328754 RepID=A0AAD4BK59_BOLED|nr:hypothetical protein L210DRAFT_924651 [Boletus edulis BED1]
MDALPPMSKISMIGIWIETMLYGVCAMYGLCMLILLRKGKVPSLRWVLVVTSTILFFLCNVHVGASLRQLLEAFVYAPDHSTIYWLDYTTGPRVLKNIIYDTLVFVQNFILIWRLYVVFMCNWKVVILPIIVAAGCVGSAYASSAVLAYPKVDLYDPVVSSLVIPAWVSGITLSISVTGAIVARLWWMGQTMASLTATSTNRFASSICIAVESGAISVVINLVVVVLYSLNSPAALTGLDVSSQLAVLTSLLIIVRVEQTRRDRSMRDSGSWGMVLIAQGEITC